MDASCGLISFKIAAIAGVRLWTKIVPSDRIKKIVAA